MGASVRPQPADDLDALIASRQAALKGTPAPAPHDDLDALIASRQAAIAPAPAAPRSSLYNAVNTVDNALTGGLGQKFNAAWNAVGDVVHGRDGFTHSFTKNLDAENEGLASFRQAHPVLAGAANVAGTVGQIAAAAPLAVAGEVATGLGLGARTAAAAKMGGAIGAAGALGNAGNRGDLVQTVVAPALKGGALGAAVGGASVPATQALGAGVNAARSAAGRLFTQAAPDAVSAPLASSITPRAASIAGADAAQTVAPDKATSLLLQRMQRAGLTPQDALDRLAQIPADKPVSVMEVAGDQSHPLRQLGKWVARTPSAGAGQLRAAIADRMEPLPNAQRVLGDVSEAMGQPRTNLVENAAQLKSQQIANAKPFYDASVNSSAVSPVPLDFTASEDGPTLGDLFKRPSIQNAVKFHNSIALERGEEPLTLPGASGASAPAEPQVVSIRDGGGRLRSDLSNVPDHELDSEWQRLAELNSKERALHEGVRDANYREDYESLPKTEKYGHKGKEDLPDADGAVDPERLLADNRIVSDYKRSAIVRKARQQAMDRIQAEINRRPEPWEQDEGDTSFNFGANAKADQVPPIPPSLKGMFSPDQWAAVVQKASPEDRAALASMGGKAEAPQAAPLKTLQQIKFKLDDMLGFAKRYGQLPDGTPATNAKLGAINETRQHLLDIMTTHSPEFGQGNAQWGGDARMQDAGERGASFLSRPISELQTDYPKMTPGEQAQHNVNAVSGPIRDRVFNTMAVDRAKMFSNPDMQERLQSVIPSDRFGTLTKKLGYEHQIALTNQAVTGGSDTAENLANDADASGHIVKSMISGAAMGRPRRILSSAIRGVVTPAVDAWVRGINEQTANALAPKLTAGMKSRPEAQAFLDELATQFDRMQRTRGSLPYAGTAAGSATGRLIGRDR